MADKFTPGSGYFHTPMSSYGSFRSYKTAPSSMNAGSAGGPPRGGFLGSTAEYKMARGGDESLSSPIHLREGLILREESNLDFEKTTPLSTNARSAFPSSGIPFGGNLTSMAEDELDQVEEQAPYSINYPRQSLAPREKPKVEIPKRKKVLQLSYLENKRAEARRVQEKKDSEYATLLKKKSLIPEPAVELNWSGRGQHVEFERSDQLPLEYIAPIGVSMNAKVDKVKCRRIMLARKIMKCDKRWSLSDALVEVEHLHRLRHAHIVQLVGTYLQHRDFAILLYPAADWDLSAFMNMSTSCLPPSLLYPIRLELLPDYLTSFFPCLASALDYVHNNTTRHCDIKPSNILVKYNPQPWTRDGGDSAIEKEKPHKCSVCGKRYKNFNWLLYHRNYLSACNPGKQLVPGELSIADENPTLVHSPFRVYLADFGISQNFVSQDQSQTDSYTGRTPKYCAPEVFDNLPYGRRADVFSLGCVFAEMYTVIAGRELEDFEDFRRGNGPNAYFHASIPEVCDWVACQVPEVERLVLSNKMRVATGNSPSGAPLWRDIYTFPLLLEFMLEENPDVRPTAKQVSEAIGVHPCCVSGPEAYVAAQSEERTSD